MLLESKCDFILEVCGKDCCCEVFEEGFYCGTAAPIVVVMVDEDFWLEFVRLEIPVGGDEEVGALVARMS